MNTTSIHRTWQKRDNARYSSTQNTTGRAVSRQVTRPRAYLEEKQAPQAPHTAYNQLEALKAMSVVVADTGEVDLVKKYTPVDCTTNPSLVYKAVQEHKYEHYLTQALDQDQAAKYPRNPSRPYSGVADILSVNIGAEMLQVVPGRVSTEVDAHLSYDTQATYDKALRLVDLYAQKGVDPSRLYIKIASTWEGIQACRQLQKEGIDCNMTLLFSFGQAAACADAGAALISPFVGRILDWHKAHSGRSYTAHEDPGVLSVKRIYKYYKRFGYNTTVMAASFRNIGEIKELAGCDKITIAPSLLAELEASTGHLPKVLWPSMGGCQEQHWHDFDDQMFTKLHGEDQMAVEKLAEGIKGFAADQDKLEIQLAKLANVL